jgi:hypothetical protein
MILHESRKIFWADFIYNSDLEIKNKIKPGKEYLKIMGMDLLEWVVLFFGIFYLEYSWPCFMGIVILGISGIQKINPLFVKIDSGLTVILYILSIGLEIYGKSITTLF